MQQRRLGNTNLLISRVGLGAMGLGGPKWRPWVVDEARARPVLERAVEMGVTFFDTSDYYSGGESERIVGKVLRELLPREDFVIATKVGNRMGNGVNSGGYSRKHILDAVDASLARLGVEYIDLYQTHVWRDDSSVEEVISAFDYLVRSGKVRYVGATDMPVWKFAKFYYSARLAGLEPFRSMQHHYNLVWREHESELIPLCEAEGIGLLPYSPLGRGYLTSHEGHGRETTRAETDEFSRQWYGRDSDRQVLDSLVAVARARDVPPAVVALAWVLAKAPTASPLVGATGPDHLAVVDAALECHLEPAEIAALEEPYVARLGYGH
jgi:aryl-alcohol dehydrogenase-like predicted oxidoreductase